MPPEMTTWWNPTNHRVRAKLFTTLNEPLLFTWEPAGTLGDTQEVPALFDEALVHTHCPRCGLRGCAHDRSPTNGGAAPMLVRVRDGVKEPPPAPVPKFGLPPRTDPTLRAASHEREVASSSRGGQTWAR